MGDPTTPTAPAHALRAVRQALRPQRALLLAKRAVVRSARSVLLAAVRAEPRPEDLVGAERRVTIWLLSAYGMGGTIRTVWNLAGWLAARGYEVELITSFRNRTDPFFGDFPPGVRVTALTDRRGGGAPRGLLARAVRELLRPVPSALVHHAERSHRHHDLWTDVQLVRRLRRRTGFVVGTRPGLNAALAQLALPGAVAIGQDHMHFGRYPKPLRRLVRRTYPGLGALAVLTDADLREWREALEGGVPIVAIPNAAREMGGPPVDHGAKVVLAAGRLGRQKGFDLLISAFAQVAADHPDWRLRIYGDGRWRRRLQRRIDKLELTDQATLEGSHPQLGHAMAEASVYALSSRFEGFPLILVEAMSKGMAVAAFDCRTGPAEIVDDHRNGLLVPPQDVDAMAGALRELMDDEDLRRRCGAAAMETAVAYTPDAIGARWEALMRDAWRDRAA